MEITAGQSFPMGGHPTIEIATDSKRSLFSSIEAELQSSEVYQKVLENLKTMLGEAGAKADSCLAAVGKEAIQLAFKKFAKKYRSELKALAKTNMSSNLEKGQPRDKLETKAKQEETGGDEEKEKAEVEVVSSGGDEESSQKSKSTTELARTEETSDAVESSSTATKGPDNNEKVEEEEEEEEEEVKKGSGSPKKKKKLTKAEKAALEKAQKRKEVLERIGQELRKARIGRCLSVQQVHAQTLVPVNHLKALEKGNIEKLPEDIYVRGFIYRLGNALGLDGATMAAALPVADPLQGMIPSWSALDGNSSLGFELRPLHLYLGYTALMAGAVGGLTAVTQHSTPGVSLMPELSNGETEAIARSNREIEVTVTPGLEFSDTGITVGSDMAPPEMMN